MLSQLPFATPFPLDPETQWLMPLLPLDTETGSFTTLLEPIEREFKVFNNFRIL
jgi:hypothetical protein